MRALRKFTVRVVLLILSLVLVMTTFSTSGNTIAQEVTCEDLEPDVFGAIPGTMIPINLPPEAEAFEVYHIIQSDEGQERKPVAILRDEEGDYYFNVPAHPPDIPIDDDMPIIIEITYEGQVCKIDFVAAGLTCDLNAFNKAVSQFETLLIMKAQHYGYAQEDLVNLTPDEVLPFIEHIWEDYYVVAHPDNINSFKAISQGTAPLLEETEIDMRFLNCAVDRLGLDDFYADSIAYFTEADSVDLSLFRADDNFGKPAFQDGLSTEEIAQLAKDQGHHAQRAEEFSNSGIDTTNSVVGLLPGTCAATGAISILRARTLNEFVKARDTLPAKVDRFTSELTPGGPFDEDFPGEITVNSAFMLLTSNGYSDTDYQLGQILNGAGAVTCAGGVVKANSKVFDVIGTGSATADMARNVASINEQSLGPKPGSVPISAWSVSFDEEEVKDYLWLLAPSDVVSLKDGSLIVLEVSGTGTTQVEIRLNGDAFGNLNASTTDTVTVNAIEVYIDEVNRIDLDNIVSVTLEGSMVNALNKSALWTYTVDGQVQTKPVSNIENDSDLTIILEKPEPKRWVGCTLAGEDNEADVNLEATTQSGARQMKYDPPVRDTNYIVVVEADVPPRPSACNPKPTSTFTPTPTVTPITGDSSIYFATLIGFTINDSGGGSACASQFLFKDKEDLRIKLPHDRSINIDAPVWLYIENENVIGIKPFSNWHGDPDQVLPVIDGVSEQTLPLEGLDVVAAGFEDEALEILNARWAFRSMSGGDWYMGNYTFYGEGPRCVISYHYVLTSGPRQPSSVTIFIDAINTRSRGQNFLKENLDPTQ